MCDKLTPCTRSFCVYFFSDPSNFTSKCASTFRRIFVTKPPGVEHHTIGQVKKEAGKAVKLLPSSLSIFGLFLGDEIGLPRRFCPDETVVPGTITEFSFQLVSFDPDVENEVICKDEKAMELVYWELKNEWGNYGFPFMAQVECNKSFFTMYKNITQKARLTSSNMLNFLQTLRIRSPCFIAHYYHVRHVEARLKEMDAFTENAGIVGTARKLTSLSYCYTEDLFVVEKLATPKEGRRQSRARVHLPPPDPMAGGPINVTVAMNMEQLVICDAVGRTELLSLDWNLVKSLRRNHKHNCFILEFLISTGQSRYITIRTDCSNFLFSISNHIISLIRSASTDESEVAEPRLESYAEFKNPLFSGIPVNEKKLHNVIAGKATELPTLDEEVEEQTSTRAASSIDGGAGSMELTAMQTSRSISVSEATKHSWNSGHSINEADQIKNPKVSSAHAKRISILQMPLSMLLPPNDTANFNKNNNKKIEGSSTLSSFGTTEKEAMEDMRNKSACRNPWRRSLALSASKANAGPNEGSKAGTQKGSAGRKKKNSADGIPRVSAGLYSHCAQPKASGARNPSQAYKTKGKAPNMKAGLPPTGEGNRRPSF